eukprot:4238998-Amphidinium_carterae.1
MRCIVITRTTPKHQCHLQPFQNFNHGPHNRKLNPKLKGAARGHNFKEAHLKLEQMQVVGDAESTPEKVAPWCELTLLPEREEERTPSTWLFYFRCRLDLTNFPGTLMSGYGQHSKQL